MTKAEAQRLRRARLKAELRHVCVVCSTRFGSTKEGSAAETVRYCSTRCAGSAKAERYRKPVQLEINWWSQPAHLTQAFEDRDAARLRVLLSARSTVDGSCWRWPRIDNKGYAVVKVRGVNRSLHRLVADVVHGPLADEPVHHRCGHTWCVNPDHLQPVTHRENIAEMLERNYYRDRIDQLEAALTALDPRHPLLAHRTVA